MDKNRIKVLSICRWASNDADETALLKTSFTLTEWVEGIKEEVDMTLAFGYNRNNVLDEGIGQVHFIKDRKSKISQKIYWPFYKEIKILVKSEKPDIIHIHDLGDFSTIGLLCLLFGSEVKIIVQDHGSLPTWKSRLFSFFYRNVDAFIFCAKGQEDIWLEKRIIRNRDNCHFVLENSSVFEPSDKAASRAKTSMSGYPIMLWAGNLVPQKGVMAVLSAMPQLKKEYPDLRLYMVYRYETLLADIEAFIRINELEANVVLLGSKRHEALGDYYNSSDIFVSGSYKEGSGYTAIEAMSCGVIPLLTDIPSFQMISKNDKVGRLWRAGDSESLISAMHYVMDNNRDLELQQKDVLTHFKQELSFDKIRNDYVAICHHILNTQK